MPRARLSGSFDEDADRVGNGIHAQSFEFLPYGSGYNFVGIAYCKRELDHAVGDDIETSAAFGSIDLRSREPRSLAVRLEQLERSAISSAARESNLNSQVCCRCQNILGQIRLHHNSKSAKLQAPGASRLGDIRRNFMCCQVCPRTP
ncbi:MAG: hypothetical protein KGI75_22030 [Rhizobiaceae bacterium]|nr:hypothetical protein [Rhizobiaceae bacterium]